MITYSYKLIVYIGGIMNSFGELLHIVRSRQNASQLVKKIGISYVYLLDIEKGARAAPKDEVLIALANNLEFREGERERFFDLAAKERKCIPVDVSQYMLDHTEIIDVVRELKKKDVSVEYLKRLKHMTMEDNNDNR